MSDWISWGEAVEVVARHFPERAEGLLHVAVRDGDRVKVWAADEGGYVLAGSPGYQYFEAQPGQPAGPDQIRHYRKVNFVELRSLKLWLKALTSEAEPAPAPAAEGHAGTRRGGVEKADWEEYSRAFAEKVAKDGYPEPNNEKGWQRQADVARWLAGLAEQDKVDVSASTLNRRAKALMEAHRPDP